jgi:hypothetical protein
MPIETILIDWTPRDWSAFGQVLLGVGAVVAGVWAVYIYGKSRRLEAARWLHGFFLTFYTHPELIAARNTLTYEFASSTAELLELRINDRDVTLNDAEQEQLRLADLILNYFEEIIYLEEEGHLSRRDRDLFFDYWLALVRKPDRAALRRYAARCGYEYVAGWADAGQEEFIALCGDLAGQGGQGKIGVAPLLRSMGPCTLSGVSALRAGAFRASTSAKADCSIFCIRDIQAIRLLDHHLGFRPEDRWSCGVRRRCMHIPDQGLDAWVYLQS